MKSLKVILSIIGLLTVTACGGGASSGNAAITGVSTAPQISVVTAQ